MELRPGYKRSDVGFVPDSWEVARLEAIADRIMVGIASAATHAYRTSGVPLFRNQNIKAGFLNDRELLFVEHAYEETFHNKRLRAGDLLTARTGYPGVTCVVPAAYEAAQSFTTLITRPKRDVVDSRFLCHFVNSDIGQAFFDKSQIGGAQKNVNAGTLRGMPVPVPPLPEQQAIAAALSDVDALLGSVERLITKKRDLKNAAMRQLLTGQTRLPGFSSKWKTESLGHVAAIRNDKVMPTLVDPSTPCVELEHVGQADGRLYSCATANNSTSSKYRFRSGDVLFGRLRPYLRKFWLADRDGICTTEIWPLRVDDQVAFNGFLHAVVQTPQFVDAASVSYGTHMPRADWGIVKNFAVHLPPLDEQRAIATAIADMDAECADLERRRDKTRLLKQGMMQELLTGRTRLV